MADYRNLVLFALRDHAQRGSLPSARQLADEFRQKGIDISLDDLAGTIDRLEREKAIGAARKKREVGKPGEISVYYPRDMGNELERQGIVGPPYRFPHPETLTYIAVLVRREEPRQNVDTARFPTGSGMMRRFADAGDSRWSKPGRCPARGDQGVSGKRGAGVS